MDKETKKKIDALEKERIRELEEARNHYADQLTKMQGRTPIKQGRIRNRKKDPSKDEQEILNLKEHALVNVEAIKEFIKYGSNKVLDQIRVRTHANVVAREEIAKLKKKEGFDLKAGMYTFMIVIIIAAMAYTISTNFLNASDLQNQLQAEKSSHGTTMGQLAACQTELAAYKPQGSRTVTPTQPSQPSGGSTIQG